MTDGPDEDASSAEEDATGTDPDAPGAGADGDTDDTGVPRPVPARQLVAEELASARDLLSRASAFVAVPEPRVLAEDARSLPPHERFESAASRHAERIGIDSLDAASIADATADLPVEEPVERATTYLVRRSARLQGRLLGQLARDPAQTRNYLVLAVAAGHLQRAAADLQHAHESGDGDLAHLASVVLALLATLFVLAEDGLGAPANRDTVAAGTNEPLAEAVHRDVALAEHHRRLAAIEIDDDGDGDADSGREAADPGTDPLERDADDLEHLLVVQGATLAVTELDASPEAVASLADVPLEHLIGVLATE